MRMSRAREFTKEVKDLFEPKSASGTTLPAARRITKALETGGQRRRRHQRAARVSGDLAVWPMARHRRCRMSRPCSTASGAAVGRGMERYSARLLDAARYRRPANKSSTSNGIEHQERQCTRQRSSSIMCSGGRTWRRLAASPGPWSASPISRQYRLVLATPPPSFIRWSKVLFSSFGLG